MITKRELKSFILTHKIKIIVWDKAILSQRFYLLFYLLIEISLFNLIIYFIIYFTS